MRLLIDCILFEQRFARMTRHPPLTTEACTSEDGLITEEYALPLRFGPIPIAFGEGESFLLVLSRECDKMMSDTTVQVGLLQTTIDRVIRDIEVEPALDTSWRCEWLDVRCECDRRIERLFRASRSTTTSGIDARTARSSDAPSAVTRLPVVRSPAVCVLACAARRWRNAARSARDHDRQRVRRTAVREAPTAVEEEQVRIADGARTCGTRDGDCLVARRSVHRSRRSCIDESAHARSCTHSRVVPSCSYVLLTLRGMTMRVCASHATVDRATAQSLVG
jgi:hypothetical protein